MENGQSENRHEVISFKGRQQWRYHLKHAQLGMNLSMENLTNPGFLNVEGDQSWELVMSVVLSPEPVVPKDILFIFKQPV